jgi:hypothetical protein
MQKSLRLIKYRSWRRVGEQRCSPHSTVLRIRKWLLLQTEQGLWRTQDLIRKRKPPASSRIKSWSLSLKTRHHTYWAIYVHAFLLHFNRNEYLESSWRINHNRRAKLKTSPSSMSRVFTRCGNLYAIQTYRSPGFCLCPEDTETSSICWARLNRFHLKAQTKPSLRNVLF